MSTQTQQFKLYDAEDSLGRGRRFESLTELQAWVDNLRDTWWWERFYAEIIRVEVGPARSRTDSVGWYEKAKRAGRMEFPPAARNVLTVTHELAHVVTEALYGKDHGHDPVFARVYANLTWFISGPQAWLRLQAAFDRHEVQYGA